MSVNTDKEMKSMLRAWRPPDSNLVPKTARPKSGFVACSEWMDVAARWREEAKRRRTDVEEQKALGGRNDDATIGYCEALEDKAGEIEAIGRAAPPNVGDDRAAGGNRELKD